MANVPQSWRPGWTAPAPLVRIAEAVPPDAPEPARPPGKVLPLAVGGAAAGGALAALTVACTLGQVEGFALQAGAAVVAICAVAGAAVGHVLAKPYAAALTRLKEVNAAMPDALDSARRQAAEVAASAHAASLAEERRRVARAAADAARLTADEAGDADARTAASRLAADLGELAGDAAAPAPAPAVPEALILDALDRVFGERRGSDVIISYELDHTHMLLVDAEKITRALTHLIAHGARCLRHKGRLWLRTHQDEAGTMDLTVGNAGAHYSEAEQAALFNSYFESGDPTAGGDAADAGLAVARRIVLAHGGTVSSRSTFESGTELTLHLPVATARLSPPAGPLPNHSLSIAARHRPGDDGEAAAGAAARDDVHPADERLMALARKLGRPLRVLIADADPRYLAVVQAQIGRSRAAREQVQVAVAASVQEAQTELQARRPDLVLFDAGFALPANALSLAGARACLVSHGDGSSPVVADGHVPKPLSRARLGKVYELAEEVLFGGIRINGVRHLL